LREKREREIMERDCECNRETKRESEGLQLQQPAAITAAASAAMRVGSRVE
jgi:hypothetical protein